MIVMQTETLEVKDSGLTLAEKYPELVGSPKTFSIQADKTYYVNVGYNTMTNNLYIKILENDNKIIQGITDLIEYPQNLLYNEIFIDYFLYFQNNKFYFGLLEDKYDITNIKSDEELLMEWDNAIL